MDNEKRVGNNPLYLSSGKSKILSISSLGTTKECPFWIGKASINEMKLLFSLRILEGISLFIIFEKIELTI